MSGAHGRNALRSESSSLGKLRRCYLLADLLIIGSKAEWRSAGYVVSTQTIILQVPDELYARLRHRAAQSQRSVEAEFVSVLVEAVPGGDELGPDLAEAAAALAQFDDDELWEVARGRFPEETSNELQALHDKQQRSVLARHESERADELCLRYERFMLMRARAALLLKERGHDVSSLLEGA